MQSSLSKTEREQIFGLFMKKARLRFSDIDKSLSFRSNMVSYHLEKMIDNGILKKEKGWYRLSKEAERIMPVFSNLSGGKMSAIPVLLLALEGDGDVLLIRRKVRPYKGYWSLIGGKILHDERIARASCRLIGEKARKDSTFISLNSVMHEMIKDKETVKHSFILFFAKAKTDKKALKPSDHGELRWFKFKDIEKGMHDDEIIPSDLWLIKNKMDSVIEMRDAVMEDHEGRLEHFRFV